MERTALTRVIRYGVCWYKLVRYQGRGHRDGVPLRFRQQLLGRHKFAAQALRIVDEAQGGGRRVDRYNPEPQSILNVVRRRLLR